MSSVVGWVRNQVLFGRDWSVDEDMAVVRKVDLVENNMCLGNHSVVFRKNEFPKDRAIVVRMKDQAIEVRMIH